MNPVVGIDVAKGESQAQIFLDRNKLYGKGFRFSHTITDLEWLHGRLKEVEKDSGCRPAIILEATGHYHLPIVEWAEEKNYDLYILNPLLAQRAKKTHLRKVKTDKLDAVHLGELYYKEEFEPYQKQETHWLHLRHLTRQHEAMTDMYVQTKLQFRAVLDQVFPTYEGVFGDLYSTVSLGVLEMYSTPGAVKTAGVDKLAECMNTKLVRGRSPKWAKEKAIDMMAAAEKSPFQEGVHESYVLSLRMFITLLLQYQEHLSKLEKQIDALAEEKKEYDLLRSIPGVGNKIAATILAEIGEIERFDHAKKLVAFAGVDPSVTSSGKFTASTNRITKRGSKRLRRALYQAVQCGVRRRKGCLLQSSVNQRLREYYDVKKGEGKPHKQVVIACVNKLIRWIYCILTRSEPYKADFQSA
ncbi:MULTISPECIES: IS110 family transposase [Bacilli]|uniref:IS110 family transposase n=3 Tax=Bacilli TaxID=91061 RepID=A0A3M8CSR5_9BACL|nr:MULTISPECIES: IS110 family transposase [Bacilli]EJD4908109.1 IS110 family transposase [Escherichia coli]MBY6289353.1 IS110 family transposase [Streptococcus suis]MBY6296519.1 IS110 family transposase [Streptococcus suis]RNB78754.1 IS110 family transposase [Brevibacillus panacihumi]